MKKITIILALLFISIGLFAQKDRQYPYNEVFFGIGTTHYFGEIGGSMTTEKSFLNYKDFDFNQTRISATVGYRRVFNRNVSLSGQIAPMWISGNDKKSFNEFRGWSFNSIGGEIASVQIEYYPIPCAYVFWGLGETYRYTIAFIPEKIIVKGFNSVLLGGIGYGHRINKYNTHSVEIGLRYCLSDTLEGLIGDTPINDFYYLIQYKFVHRLTFGHRFNKHGLLIQ